MQTADSSRARNDGILVGLLKFICALLALLTACGSSHALDSQDLLEPDKAFRFSARALNSQTIEVSYRIADGYYLYLDRFKFEAEPKSVTLGTAQFPKGLVHEDKFFGKQEIFRRELRFTIPVASAEAGSKLKLFVTSQGCADAGVCYVPQKQSADLVLVAGTAAVGGGGRSLLQQLESQGRDAVGATQKPEMLSASDVDIAALFESGGFWLVMVSFLGFGLLLSFTPCMLPMLPILSGIIAGEGRDLGKLRALLLSLSYVLGMAVAYALAGVAAAYSGTLLAAALQNPWVLTLFALVFVWLALAMFGFHDIQLPSFVHHRLHAVHHKLEGGRVVSVALMGALSAVIVSPCVAAPLAGALLYISQSRDVVLGGTALFVMALGMGIPLIAVGVSEGALLPKSGPWMKTVKQFFGVLLLGVAVWIVSPVISVAVQMLAWAVLLIVAAVMLRAFDRLPAAAGSVARAGKALGIVALLGGAAMLVGLLSGGRDPLRPLAGLFSDAGQVSAPVRFERVRTLAELDQRVKTAGRPVMLDFYADWCVSCKEMERFTFTDARVQARLSEMLLLQADVTANTPEDQELLKRFRLFGPPGIIFFDAAGVESNALRVIGYQSPERFIKSLERLREPAASPGV